MKPEELEQLMVKDYRPPSPEEVRAFLKRHGLTGAQAGAIAGIGGRQVRKYTGSDADVPYAVWFTWWMKLESHEPPKNDEPQNIGAR